MILFWKITIIMHLYVHSVMTRPPKTTGGRTIAGTDERMNARVCELGPKGREEAEVRVPLI